MTPSIGFSDITDGNQSPSCNICVVNYRLNGDLSRGIFLNDMQSNGSNSAIDINDNDIDILRVKYGRRGSNLVAV